MNFLSLLLRFGFITGRLLSRSLHQNSLYQCVSGLVLINRADPGPVEVQKQRHSRCVEGVFRRHDPKEIREAIGCEHRMGVRIAELQQ